jgi:pimeloyl-ACP methyl ester carboxylesterase
MTDWWQQTFPQGKQTIRITDANNTSVNIAYGEIGHGQPLILVHGVGVWSHYWRHNIPVLAQHFRVIVFDAKGCGFSDRPLAPEPVGHQVIELANIIEALCDRPAILVAESLGALTTLALAADYSHLVDQLIVINVPIFPKELPSWGMKLLSTIPLQVVQVVDMLRIPKVFAPLTQQLAAIARRDVVVDSSTITFDEVYWTTYPYMEFPYTLTKLAEDLQIGLKQINALLEGKPSYIRDIQTKLSSIHSPTLILWSEHDSWFSVEDGQKLHQAMPNATFQIIPNCGHQAAAGRPEFVNSAILSFLI